MLPLETIIYRLLWAALLGAAIGMERLIRRRPAGIRTGVCVSVGAALFTILSVEIARTTGDSGTTRIASNIVQGIGFLGAGVILRERGSVTGLTTAATIFVVAASGYGGRCRVVSCFGLRVSAGAGGAYCIHLRRELGQPQATLHVVSHFVGYRADLGLGSTPDFF